VRREVILPASRQEAWAALTRSEELSAWFEADVEIDPHPRGTLAIRFPDGTTRTGAVLAADPPYRLVLVWEEARDAGGLEAQASRVEFTLHTVDEGTLLTVIETPLPASASELRLYRAMR